jgi:hypothetical protein
VRGTDSLASPVALPERNHLICTHGAVLGPPRGPLRVSGKGVNSLTNHVHIAGLFLLSVLAANIFWNFLIRGWSANHADSPAVQALANLT